MHANAKQGKRSIVLNKNSGYLNEFLVIFCYRTFWFRSLMLNCIDVVSKCIYWIIEDLSIPVKFA